MENEKIQTTEAPKKKSKKKWIIIAIVIIALVAVFSGGGSESTTVNPGTGENTTAKPETHEIKVGYNVTDSEVKISFKSCNSNFKNYSTYADIKNGYKIIEAVFDFENISENNIILEGFDCYADGVKCEEFYSVNNYSSPTLESLSAGRKLTDASVYFEVPADAVLIELEYEADYWTGEKYIFIVE